MEKSNHSRTYRDRALRGRIGGFQKAARYPADELTRAAREGFLAKFTAQVDPDGLLQPEERRRRAEAARRAYMAKLALKSAVARRSKIKKATVAAVAEEADDAASASE